MLSIACPAVRLQAPSPNKIATNLYARLFKFWLCQRLIIASSSPRFAKAKLRSNSTCICSRPSSGLSLFCIIKRYLHTLYVPEPQLHFSDLAHWAFLLHLCLAVCLIACGYCSIPFHIKSGTTVISFLCEAFFMHLPVTCLDPTDKIFALNVLKSCVYQQKGNNQQAVTPAKNGPFFMYSNTLVPYKASLPSR